MSLAPNAPPPSGPAVADIEAFARGNTFVLFGLAVELLALTALVGSLLWSIYGNMTEANTFQPRDAFSKIEAQEAEEKRVQMLLAFALVAQIGAGLVAGGRTAQRALAANGRAQSAAGGAFAFGWLHVASGVLWVALCWFSWDASLAPNGRVESDKYARAALWVILASLAFRLAADLFSGVALTRVATAAGSARVARWTCLATWAVAVGTVVCLAIVGFKLMFGSDADTGVPGTEVARARVVYEARERAFERLVFLYVFCAGCLLAQIFTHLVAWCGVRVWRGRAGGASQSGGLS